MIQVYDDFIDSKYADEIDNLFQSAEFPWYFQKNITNYQDTMGKKTYGFTHNFIADGKINSEFLDFFSPFLFSIKNIVGVSNIARMRGDMTTQTDKVYKHVAHVDSHDPHYASIYYVNDSDGDTVFYNEKFNNKEIPKEFTIYKTVSPKKNRLVVFDGSIYHTGHSPNNTPVRIIININMLKE
jgi:hypothetical protein